MISSSEARVDHIARAYSIRRSPSRSWRAAHSWKWLTEESPIPQYSPPFRTTGSQPWVRRPEKYVYAQNCVDGSILMVAVTPRLGIDIPLSSGSFDRPRNRVNTDSMKRKSVITRKKRGPPATGKGTLVGVRLQPNDLMAVDDWIARQDEAPTRPEAIRTLMRQSLRAKK